MNKPKIPPYFPSQMNGPMTDEEYLSIKIGHTKEELEEKIVANRYAMLIMSILIVFLLVLFGIGAVAIKNNQVHAQEQIELMDAKTDLLIRCVFVQQIMIENLENKQNFNPFDSNPLDYKLDLSGTDVDKVTQRE